MHTAIFDFDGTLYTGHIWRDLVQHLWQTGVHRRWVVAYIVWNMAPMPLYRAGLLQEEAYFRAWGETMAWLVRGWTEDQGQAIFEQLTDQRIQPNLRESILSRLREHQARGDQVFLVSGSFDPWLKIVARRLEVSHAIGTPLVLRDGRFSGHIIPPLCQGAGKLERLSAYVAKTRLKVNWTDSSAYADRWSDLPVLKRVGQPVAVFPDEKLRGHAQAQGWRILDGATG